VKTVRIAMSGPGEVVDTCLDAFVRLHGWTDTVGGEPNPVSQAEKARRVLFAYILDSVKFYQRQQAEAAAIAAAHAAVEQLVPLTSLTLEVETGE
jgi:hypothetical protein